MEKLERIEKTVIYELYINLSGMSSGWVECIYKVISDEAEAEYTVVLDQFTTPATEGIKFQTTSKEEINRVEKKVRMLID